MSRQVWRPVEDGQYAGLAPVSIERLVMSVENNGEEVSQVYADIPAGINTIYLPDNIRLCELVEIDAPAAMPAEVREAIEAVMRLADDAYTNVFMYNEIIQDWLDTQA